jgi:hypothetical protein
LVLLITLLIGLNAANSVAHSVNVPMAALVVHRDGTFTVDANFDLPAYVLNDTPVRIGDDAMNAWMDGDDATIAHGLADAKKRLEHGIVVTTGGDEFRATLSGFIGVDEVHAWRSSGIKPRLPMMAPATLHGVLPAGATSLAIRFPEVLGPVMLTVERPAEEPVSASLEPGEASEAFAIHLPMNPPAAPAASTASVTRPAPSTPVAIVFVLGVLIFSIAVKVVRRTRLRQHV